MTKATSTEVRGLLAARAFLFDDPAAYMAGVDEALGHIGVTPTLAVGRLASTRPGFAAGSGLGVGG